ncbi:hypothetical protein LAZ67_16002852 [Cordylochernes scorpioides]|uniref:Mariner Mos1 transposase n=1 Tax=Cordylochernes scorpioides TaxID=51811 RepID=A0ABY6LCA4_9ARAC|nr:hypothetical protein LAZ67_16002852 [Cordylochernes scorpioides]
MEVKKTLHKPKKTRKMPSKIKTMLITFFDSRGIIHKEFVPARQTITGEYYLNVLKRLIARIRRIRPEYRNEDSWCLLHDNAPSHSSLIVRRFLAKNNICVLNHPPYSPDLAPCDFYLFPKIKLKLKGCFFFMISRPSRQLRRALWRRFLKFHAEEIPVDVGFIRRQDDQRVIFNATPKIQPYRKCLVSLETHWQFSTKLCSAGRDAIFIVHNVYPIILSQEVHASPDQVMNISQRVSTPPRRYLLSALAFVYSGASPPVEALFHSSGTTRASNSLSAELMVQALPGTGLPMLWTPSQGVKGGESKPQYLRKLKIRTESQSRPAFYLTSQLTDDPLLDRWKPNFIERP